MDSMEQMGSCLGKRTLIVGDVNTGKTTLTRKILEALCHEGLGNRILVLDLAPRVPKELASRAGLEGVGGELHVPDGSQALYMRPPLVAPRLSAGTPDEAMALADKNRLAVERFMELADTSNRDILFINDASLYLQAGSARRLVDFMGGFSTVVANGYMGERLGGGPLSSRERSQMEALSGSFDRVIRLGTKGTMEDRGIAGKGAGS